VDGCRNKGHPPDELVAQFPWHRIRARSARAKIPKINRIEDVGSGTATLAWNVVVVVGLKPPRIRLPLDVVKVIVVVPGGNIEPDTGPTEVIRLTELKVAADVPIEVGPSTDVPVNIATYGPETVPL
jgi:hypothetical protein